MHVDSPTSPGRLTGRLTGRLAIAIAIATAAALACAIAFPAQAQMLWSDGFEADGSVPEGPSGPPGVLAFENVTTLVVDRTDVDSEYRFDALWTDFNGDGCYDPMIFDHAPATSRLWVHACDGTNRFTYASNDVVRHYIANPFEPRGTGWVTLIDADGDGRQDLWTRDADVNAAVYVNDSALGATPHFADKRDACPGRNLCSFADIDGDGTLDAILDDRRVQRISGLQDIGDRPQILPAAGTAGLRTVGDVDGDGWPDLVQPDAAGWWRNDQGQLTWVSAPALRGSRMLMTLADLDNDGDLDLFTHADGGPGLFRNDGQGNFTDVTADAGLSGIGFSDFITNYGNVVAADFDNDARQDLLVVGGSGTIKLMQNLGGLRFEQADVGFGSMGNTAKPRASAADFDNDGRLDVVRTQGETNVGIWRNRTTPDGTHWMKLRVRGPGANADGIGAQAFWYRAGTDHLIAMMEVRADNQHALTWLHTGLGDATEVDLVVRYPHGGPTVRHDGLAADQEVIAYPNGCLIEDWVPGAGWPLEAPPGCGS